jgi:hypothetical protein
MSDFMVFHKRKLQSKKTIIINTNARDSTLEKAAEDLIELIARAAINPDGWRDMLSRMAELLPGTKIILAAGDARSIGNAGSIYTGFSDWSMQAYAEHFSKVNPWTPYLMRLPTMLAAVSDEVMPSAGFRDTEFYEDWLNA